jgi:putative methanogenesis marker protein 3
MQLLDTVEENDKITVITKPEKISTVAMTQAAADEYLSSINIEHTRDGLTDDDAIIVAQDPLYTVDVTHMGKLSTLGVPKEDFVEIELYEDESPSSVWYFRKITGLLDGDVGHLRVNMAIKEMDLVMFKAVNKEAKGLIPEKLPDGIVHAWDICVSNTACKHVGNIGIRFVDNTEFGPTGESFNSTNIIGRVIAGCENFKGFKEGDTVYVREK